MARGRAWQSWLIHQRNILTQCEHGLRFCA
jgi:hypothetical protein